MKLKIIFPLLLSAFLMSNSWSQDFTITPPKLVFEGNQLLVLYDVISKSPSDKFHIWIEMEKKNGEHIEAKALSGDIGDIKAGKNKTIIWIPERDAVFIDEEVFVEVKAEKYVALFNKGSSILMSAAFPGLGQTKISQGKPYWLTGLAVYGALAGGLIFSANANKNYDNYSTELNALKRADLFDQAQAQQNISNALLITAAALWTVNMIWVTTTPKKYKPLNHLSLSLDETPGSNRGTVLFTMRFNF